MQTNVSGSSVEPYASATARPTACCQRVGRRPAVGTESGLVAAPARDAWPWRPQESCRSGPVAGGLDIRLHRGVECLVQAAVDAAMPVRGQDTAHAVQRHELGVFESREIHPPSVRDAVGDAPASDRPEGEHADPVDRALQILVVRGAIACVEDLEDGGPLFGGDRAGAQDADLEVLNLVAAVAH